MERDNIQIPGQLALGIGCHKREIRKAFFGNLYCMAPSVGKDSENLCLLACIRKQIKIDCEFEGYT